MISNLILNGFMIGFSDGQPVSRPLSMTCVISDIIALPGCFELCNTGNSDTLSPSFSTIVWLVFAAIQSDKLSGLNTILQ